MEICPQLLTLKSYQPILYVRLLTSLQTSSGLQLLQRLLTLKPKSWLPHCSDHNDAIFAGLPLTEISVTILLRDFLRLRKKEFAQTNTMDIL